MSMTQISRLCGNRARRALLPVLGAVLMLCMLPHEARAWWNSDWSYRKQIAIDAGAGGGAITADPGRVPILIRLHDGDFKFTDAKEDGSDLRFIAEDDKTPLKYHVEKFDAVFDLGVVWVDVPDLKAGKATNIWMYYGNTKATPADDAKGTYDPDQVLVYHFAEREGPPRDVTAYANNASTAAGIDDASLIGSGAKFNGSNTAVIPATPSLQIAAGGALTWSAWIKADPASKNAILYARHDGNNAMIIGLADGAPYVAVGDTTAGLAHSDPIPALSGNAWHLISVTAAADITLYVDGQAAKTLAATLPALNGPATLGGDAGVAGASPATAPNYTGALDELEISKVARPAAFIQTAFASQGPDGKLLKYGQDEQTSSWSSGYFGVILRSVTLDGWVVIIFLLIMAVISWMVMVNRAIYVARVSRTNKKMVAAYEASGQDLGRFEQLMSGKSGALSEADRKVIEDAPLYRVFRAGQSELQLRLDEQKAAGDEYFVLSSQTIEAIRASVNAVLVAESQRLNALMILLTIAISGGPFIGLLGTVVGVMITFVAIAASGDVNVNAIAPGIAAALVATVAGLFVAIPALFGYNYFLAQIRDTTAQIQVFADKFITRIAELYRAPSALRQIAAE
jgi:biopolymer transport protein ExbB